MRRRETPVTFPIDSLLLVFGCTLFPEDFEPHGREATAARTAATAAVGQVADRVVAGREVLADATADGCASGQNNWKRKDTYSHECSVVDSRVLLVTTEGGLSAVTAEWGVDDVLLESAGPAEVEARIRLAIGRLAASSDIDQELTEIRRGDVTIDEATYTAKVRSRSLDLTFKEFELLKFLAQHPGRVFTRAQLLQEVWGYDYYGGTRTVDVHIRRLRAKLGSEHEVLIGTVRNVGYRFVPAEDAPVDA